jgi:hypothetical protein
MYKLTASSRASSLRQRKGESMESKEDFIREVRELLNANEKVVYVELNQIVDMVHELAESYRY